MLLSQTFSADVLNGESLQQINKHFDALWPLAMTYGINLISALAILVVGVWLSGRARKWVRVIFSRVPNLDVTLAGFFGNLLRYLVLLVTGLAVLGKFGVDITSLIAVLGAAGLAIGFALQSTLSNVAAGVMLLMFRPFKAGDYVEVAGNLAGSIKGLSLFTTELLTSDNLNLTVPNNQIWSQPIKNFSQHPTRRLDILVRISYQDKIGDAIAALVSEAEADHRVLTDPAPVAVVNQLDQSAIEMLLRVWTATSDYWPVRYALNRRVKERLDDEGITIPYPTSTQYAINLPQPADKMKPETTRP